MHDRPSNVPGGRAARLLADADLCVKCGLCLPHCPTYGLTREEGESPRGRIALAQGLAEGRLAPTGRLVSHLGRCLVCRACESACPAGVPYGRIIDDARTLLREQRRPGVVRRVLARLAAEAPVARPAWYRALVAVLRRHRASALAEPLERALRRVWPRVGRLAGYLPPLAPYRPWRSYYPAEGTARGEVALFLGCVAREVDQATLQAAVRVLNRLGYGVHVPRDQGCCGAIHLHDGAHAEGVALAARNLRAFRSTASLPVVAVASGCAATLAEYDQIDGLPGALGEEAAAFAPRVVEATAFLARVPWPGEVPVAPLPGRVAVHVPCTLRNVLRAADAPFRVLERVPGLEPVPLPDNHRCCGSAGAYMLTHPEVSDRLRDMKVEGITATGARLLVTENVGCALHLVAGMKGVADAPEVLHPVVILDRQMDAARTASTPGVPEGQGGPDAV